MGKLDTQRTTAHKLPQLVADRLNELVAYQRGEVPKLRLVCVSRSQIGDPVREKEKRNPAARLCPFTYRVVDDLG
jgi:hypothetical protein